ncbi:vacuolar membrane-associated protein iml1 [Borealophlyctis nickersoniae]|nr:vacuolar membrane-associated protein iml1 [Borealophlyctis nickersoniae]
MADTISNHPHKRSHSQTSLQQQQSKQGKQLQPAPQQLHNLWVHDERFSKQDLVINPDCFPGIRLGDCLEIFHPVVSPPSASFTTVIHANGPNGKRQQLASRHPRSTPRGGSGYLSAAGKEEGPGERSRKLILQVATLDSEIIAKQPQLQISIAQHIAALFELQPRTDVVARKVEKENIAADFIELSFRDQYVGRSDMWRLKLSVVGTCVHQSKKVSSFGIRAQVKDVFVNGRVASCGYVTPNTKTIFRSETAKYFIFIQMSKEMWEFDEDGELFFEKCVHGFLPELFGRWKELGTNHVVSVVLFSRIFYSEVSGSEAGGSDSREGIGTNSNSSIDTCALPRDPSNRPYRDFYRVIVDWEVRSDWAPVLPPLKKEFLQFQRDVLQQPDGEGGSTVLSGTNSPACEGNILEAVNLALNPFDKHYIDRDLARTGLSIIVITPGTGIFEVDKRLLRLTTQRMIDNGIGLDLVCLSRPPLYTVPLFQFVSKEMSPGAGTRDSSAAAPSEDGSMGKGGYSGKTEKSFDKQNASEKGGDRRVDGWDPLYVDDPSPDNPEGIFYTIPFWVDCSFWDRGGTGGVAGSEREKFILRCKMYEVQMMGVMEQIGSNIFVPYLDLDGGDGRSTSGMGGEVSTPTTGEFDVTSSARGGFASAGPVNATGGGRSHSPGVLGGGDIYEKYDDAVFQMDTRRLAKARTGSVLVMGTGLSFDGDGTGKQRGVSPAVLLGGAPAVAGASGSNISLSPENSAVFPKGYYRTGETVRSLDSDLMRGNYASDEGSAGGDTMSAEERIALLRAKNRIEQARMMNSGGTIRTVASSSSLATMFGAGSRGGGGGVAGGVPTTPGPPAEGGDLANDRRYRRSSIQHGGRMQGRSEEPGLAIVIDQSSSTAGGTVEGHKDGDDVGAVSTNTSLAPIRIRSGNYRGYRADGSDMTSVQQLRNSYSESFKAGSPLADYPRPIHIKASPGKPSMLLPGSSTAGQAPLVSSNYRLAPMVRQNHINPCNPTRNIIKQSSQLRRWQHVFPRYPTPTRNGITTHWKSLCTPACLPLTTDYFPTAEELAAFYKEYTYSVSPADDVTPYQDGGGDAAVERLIIEMISQRLSQGFQLIVGWETKTGTDGPNVMPGASVRPEPEIPLRSPPRHTRAVSSSSTRSGASQLASTASANESAKQKVYQYQYRLSVTHPYYLSLGDHVHKLFYDASGKNVEVKRYVRFYNTDPIEYTCNIWPKDSTTGYAQKTVTFAYPPHTTYKWNYLDQLIAGYQDEMTDDLRFWRTRFLLVPAESVSVHNNVVLNPSGENLDEEELRLAGFNKFLEVFEKAMWSGPGAGEEDLHGATGATGGSKKGKGQRRKIEVLLTTFNTAAFIKNEVVGGRGSVLLNSNGRPRRWSMNSSSSGGNGMPVIPAPATPERPCRTSPFPVLAQAMQLPGGVTFMDRRWHFRTYEKVFVGSECVDWMVRTLSDINTREEAVDFGNELLEQGFFEHANRKHRFLDGHYFYRLKPDFMKDAGKKEKSWFGVRKSSGSAETSMEDTSDGSAAAGATTPNTSGPPVEHHNGVRPFSLTRCVVIDLDPQRRSPRREMAMLHHDTTHNPKNCYHFELHWLVCTPRLIEDLLQSWTRMADKCGLKLVEAPVEQAQPFADDNPFQSVIPIDFSVQPPAPETFSFAVPKNWFETELLRKFNFVLDVESDEMFPHGSVKYSFTRSPYPNTQFVHRSGVAFVQIDRHGGALLWVNNGLHLAGTSAVASARSQQTATAGPTSSGGSSQTGPGGMLGSSAPTTGSLTGPPPSVPPHTSSSATSSAAAPNPDTIRQALTQFCSNAVELENFWNETAQKLREVGNVVGGVANASGGGRSAAGGNNATNSTDSVRGLEDVVAGLDFSIHEGPSPTFSPTTPPPVTGKASPAPGFDPFTLGEDVTDDQNLRHHARRRTISHGGFQFRVDEGGELLEPVSSAGGVRRPSIRDPEFFRPPSLSSAVGEGSTDVGEEPGL